MKRNIYLMEAIAFFQGMVFYGSIATLYRQAAGVTIFQITLIESISLALTIFLELPWGIAAEKIGYRHTMILCCALYLVSKIIFWQADCFSLFLLERILLSVVCAGLSGVDTSMLFLSCKSGESQKVFGRYNSLEMAGLLTATGIYSLFLADNYRMAGLLTVVSYGISAALALGLKEVKAPEKKKGTQFSDFTAVLRQTFRNKKLLCLVIAAALLNETHQVITVFLNQLQYVNTGMSTQMISAVYGIITLAGLTGGLSAWITGRFGYQKTGGSLFLLCSVSCLGLALTNSAFVSVLAVLLLRLCYTIFQPLQTELQNQEITTDKRATALSMNAVLMNAIAVFTNLMFGKAAQINIKMAMAIGCGLCLLGWTLYRTSRRMERVGAFQEK